MEGLKHNIKPGQWYGPQMISIVLRNLAKSKPNHTLIKGFKIHVCLDSNIFLDEIESLFKGNCSVFVLIPVRLGIDSIQQQYLDQVKNLFQIYQNVGIAGGKDHMALYLVGHEDINKESSGMFYLDPHMVQNSIS
jgi:cysteine protease ATG4